MGSQSQTRLSTHAHSGGFKMHPELRTAGLDARHPPVQLDSVWKQLYLSKTAEAILLCISPNTQVHLCIL